MKRVEKAVYINNQWLRFYAIVCDMFDSWLRYCKAFGYMYTTKWFKLNLLKKSDINNDELLYLWMNGSEHCRKM